MKKNLLILILTLLLMGCSEVKTEEDDKEALDLNAAGIELMNAGNYGEALLKFEKASEIQEDNDIFSNNISWAYYYLDDYANAIKYAEKALVQGGESYETHVNYANPLLDTARYDEAVEQYTNALRIDDEGFSAYYGRGLAYYWLGEYLRALDDFYEASSIKRDDVEVKKFIAYTLVNLGETKEAFDILISTFDVLDMEKNIDTLYDLAVIAGDYNIAVEAFEKLDEMYPEIQLLKFYIGKVNSLAGNYNKALSFFEEYTNNYPEDIYGYIWCVHLAKNLDNYELAHFWANKMLKLDENNIDVLYALADLYYAETDYLTAIEYYEKILHKTYDRESVYYDLIDVLMISKRYTKAVKVCEEAVNEFNSNINFVRYLGLNYSHLGQREKAILCYKYVLEIEPLDDLAYDRIAWEYILLGDYKKAREAAEAALEINSENDNAIKALSEIELKAESIYRQIENVFNNYYLYDYDLSDIEDYKNKKGVSMNDIENLIEDIKDPNDEYSFALTGESYDNFRNSDKKTVSYEYLDEDTIYTKITSFSSNTDTDFVNMLDSVNDSENKHLIIDLRSNFGGATSSANNILDAMLPVCVTSYLIYKDGYMHNFYSDASHISFDKISILINGGTASASELMTLALKKYHKDVTIYGQDSVGKGVGQYVYDDVTHKMLIVLVNHYWNVKEANVSEGKISPDIYVEGEDLQSFLDAVFYE